MQRFVTTPFDLEITVLSAESLVMRNKSKKNAAFVSVYVDPDESTWQSTSVVDVGKGETSATWNERLKVPGVSMYHAKHVTFEVRLSRKSMLTGKSKIETVCTAHVPVSDLVEGHVANDCVRFLSYRLRDRDGEGSGIIDFSVRVKGLDQVPELGVQRWLHHQQAGGGGGVVVGIPATWYL